jgi:hypothetical protein
VQHGADPKRVRAAVALLHTEDQRIGRSSSGEIIFKVRKGSGAAAYEDELPLEDGVKEWLGTDDGKLYVAPKGVRGTGAAPGGNVGGKGNAGANGGQRVNMTPQQRQRAAALALAGALEFDAPEESGEGG